MLATKIVQNRWKAAAMMVLGIGATVVACESRLPQEPQPRREEVRMSSLERTALTANELQMTESRAGEVIARNYPPLLREAGIGGTVRVRAKSITNGKLVDPEIIGTSGHEALDAAGLRAAREIEYPTDLAADKLEMVIVFDPNRKVRTVAPTMLPLMRTEALQKVSQEPSFTPFTQKPDLVNRDEVMAALVKNYPPALKGAGIGGTALVWVLLDETGNVIRTKIKETSGHAAIDDAALQVGKQMRFKPARNGSEAVPVWIALPIVMKTE